jgi:hypothetical protein
MMTLIGIGIIIENFDFIANNLKYSFGNTNMKTPKSQTTRESFYALGLRVITRNFGCNANYRATTRYVILKA